ncbi:hypothetical protein BsWGS_20206 [Bradybaena similaris]
MEQILEESEIEQTTTTAFGRKQIKTDFINTRIRFACLPHRCAHRMSPTPLCTQNVSHTTVHTECLPHRCAHRMSPTPLCTQNVSHTAVHTEWESKPLNKCCRTSRTPRVGAGAWNIVQGDRIAPRFLPT